MTGPTDPKLMRERLRFGARSGFAVTTLLIGLVFLIHGLAGLDGVLAPLLGLAALKLTSNTTQWFAARAGRHLWPAAAFNVTTDVLVITGAVYFTGGPESIAMPLYIVAMALIGLISNARFILGLGLAMLSLYALSLVLMVTHVIPSYPSFFAPDSTFELTWATVLIEVALLGFYLTFTGVAVAAAVQQQRKTERELDQKSHELHVALEQREAFFSSVTHELKTPIHGIMGLTELISDGVYGEMTERQTAAIGGIERGTARLLAIVKDLLEYQRMTSGAISVNTDEFTLTTVANELLEASAWASEQRNVVTTFDLPDIKVESDERIFRHVFHNLMTNAMKFSPDDGTVRVYATAEEGRELVLCFEDQGPPISEDEQQLLFDAYWQVRTTPRAFGGTGLTLAVAKALVDVLGGTLTVDNLDPGARFCMRLPGAVSPDSG